MRDTLANQVPRLVLLGTRGVLSVTVLQQLLEQKRWIVAAVLPAERGTPFRPLPPPPPAPSDLPLVASYVNRTVQELSWEQGIPVWEAGRLDDRALSTLRRLAPELIVVACWPGPLPPSLLSLPRWGCLNVHPSLLPDFRGPAPLFWQLRAGMTESGVTIHQVEPALDTGPILAQTRFPLPEGATGEELDRIAGREGGALLHSVLETIESGQARPQPQPVGGSYQSWPEEEDFTVPTHWSARRAWNFMRGTAEWGVPFRIQTSEEEIVARVPLSYKPDERLEAVLVREVDRFAVQFNPGVVRLLA